MNLKEYIKNVIADFEVAEGNEYPGGRYIEFDIGISVSAGKIVVNDMSTNRIKFTLEVKRA